LDFVRSIARAALARRRELRIFEDYYIDALLKSKRYWHVHGRANMYVRLKLEQTTGSQVCRIRHQWH